MTGFLPLKEFQLASLLRNIEAKNTELPLEAIAMAMLILYHSSNSGLIDKDQSVNLKSILEEKISRVFKSLSD